MRLTSTGSGAGRRRGPLGSGMLPPKASTRGAPSVEKIDSGLSAAALTARLESRVSPLVPGPVGAAITTRCPRSASSSEMRATNSLTSWPTPQGRGVTCAIENRSGEGTAAG